MATRADEAELRAFLRNTPTPGGVSLAATREPDYFAGEGAGGATDTTIVARLDGRVVCMGRCSRRTLYVGGTPCEIGYLGELRLAPGTPRGIEGLREGYAFFSALEASRPAEAYFTCIATENRRARAVLESGRAGLPRYRGTAELNTFAWPVPRRAARSGLPQDAEADAGELTRFLEAEGRRRALTTPWSEASLAALARHGLGAGDFRVVRRGRRIVAAAALWDQSAWRQTLVAEYSGGLRVARPWLNAALRVAGRPGLPAAGERLRRGCVHGLVVSAGEERCLPELWARLESEAARRGVEWLVVTLDARDVAIWNTLPKRMGTQIYGTRLHLVELPGLGSARWNFVDGELLRPDAGWL